MVMPAHVRDVDETNFQQLVLERSRSVPVVVDFWAAWCGPCRLLGPTLERSVAALDGQIELAKINTDENPRLATQYRIEGIPAVKAFRDGALVDEFTGALPEPQVKAFLQGLLPSQADQLAEAAVREAYAGNREMAEATYRRALEQDRGHKAANLGLARLLSARGETAEALRLLDNIPGDPEAARFRAEISLSAGSPDADEAGLADRIAREPADVDARYLLGRALAARGVYEDALELLLDVVRLDRKYEDDAGRKAMLEIFAVLGDGDPLTQAYRRRLGSLLF